MASRQKFTAVDLVAGKTYRVVVAFKDFDGDTHEAGESWQYADKNYFPYESGLTLYLDEGGTRQLRLQWDASAQAQIIENFSDYVEEV